MPDFMDDVIPDETPSESSDPVCKFPGCGTPLTYGGRGRRPTLCDEHKRTGSNTARPSGRTGNDVQSAMAALGMLYDGVSAGLAIFAPETASKWVRKIGPLQEKNAQVLAQDKELCKSINRLGTSSARGTFVAAHLFAVAPVVLSARAEVRGRREGRVPDYPPASQDAPDVPDNLRPFLPGKLDGDERAAGDFPNASWFGA